MKYRKINIIIGILLVVSNTVTPAMAADELAPASQAETVNETASASASVQDKSKTTINNEDTVKTVIVTATKTKKKSIEVPANVTVITADDIKKNNYQNMKEIIREVPGFIVQELTGENALIGVRVPSQMGAVSQFKVLVDGTQGSLTDVDVNSIEKIEIIRGPNSALYGTNAAGGIVNIFLKKGENKNKYWLKTEVGGFGNQNFNLGMRDSNEKMDYNILLRLNYQDGWRTNNQVQSNIFTGKFNYYLSDTSNMYFSVGRHVFPLNRNPGGLNRTQFETNPAQSPIPWSMSWSDGNRYALGYSNNLSDTQNLSLDTSYSLSNSIGLGSSGQTNTNTVAANNGADAKIKYSHKNLLLNNAETVMGIDYTNATSDSYTNPVNVATGAVNTASKTVDLYSTVGYSAAYLQEEIAFSNQLKSILGVRYDNAQFDSTDRLKNTQNTKNMGMLTPKATLSYQLNDNQSMYLSVGQAFTPPTINQLFRNAATTAANPDLKPELATNYEIGYKSEWDKLAFNITAFNMDITDNIIVGRAAAAVPGFANQYQNAGQTNYKGVEMGSGYRFDNNWSLNLGYTYEDARFVNYTPIVNGVQQNYNGKIVHNVPQNQVTTNLRYTSGPFTMNIENRINTGFYEGPDNLVYYPGHALTDLKFSWNRPEYDVSLVLTNIFNTKWIGYASSNVSAAGVISESILPGDPIKAMVSFTYKF
jgi:iron complex outermembrane receptor protein